MALESMNGLTGAPMKVIGNKESKTGRAFLDRVMRSSKENGKWGNMSFKPNEKIYVYLKNVI